MSARDDHADGADHRDLDAPSPPGGPLRQDEPDADVNPIGPVDPSPRPDPAPDDPDVRPSSNPEGPATIPAPPAPDAPADPHPEQEENAATSLDQPSDGSGGE
jgi:hypothetical protein